MLFDCLGILCERIILHLSGDIHPKFACFDLSSLCYELVRKLCGNTNILFHFCFSASTEHVKIDLTGAIQMFTNTGMVLLIVFFFSVFLHDFVK